MRRLLTPAGLGALAGLIVVVTGFVLYLAPSGDYILLPDVAHPVAPLVEVQGGHVPKGPGGIYFVDVFERRASELESIFPWLHSEGTLVPAQEIVPPGVSDAAARQADLREMTISQQVAAAVALRRLGYRVTTRSDGVIVSELVGGSNAAKVLRPADVIVSVDGSPTPTVAKLRARLAGAKIGQVVRLGIRRGSRTLNVAVKTVADPLDPKRAIVGFTPDQSASISLPIHVSIDAGNVGGPSAGLAFALEVMEQLGRNVDHGYRVAATGEMELDGTVAPIGGVKQKTYGARKAHADLFLVPAGDNAAEARRYAHGLRIVAVKSFPQALRVLATLPAKG
ncbi:MAG TPA: S16 family serine protease [Gaiellaceae bacterium]|nr:S16 family serine protease [Gaiellaceae bacterium]